MDLPCADEVNFWKTGKSSPDSWIDKAIRLIEDNGGELITRAHGQEGRTGREAFMLEFEIEDQRYKLVWPVLPTREKGDEAAARRQAATMVYHDTKNRLLKWRIFGARAAFFEYMKLPDGRVMSELATPEIEQSFPRLLTYGE